MSSSVRIPPLRLLVVLGLAAAFFQALGPERAVSRSLDVPFVPTPQAVVEKMLEMAELKPTDVLLDLGSGDGRIAITAAKKYGITASGVDLDPVRVAEAKENAEKEGVADKVKFREGDLFQTDLSKATVITMYLLSDINMKLRPSLMQLKPGTRIVSHAFDMGDWTPDQTATVEGREVFLWIVREAALRETRAPKPAN